MSCMFLVRLLFLVFFLFLVLGFWCVSWICGFISILIKSDKSSDISLNASPAPPPPVDPWSPAALGCFRVSLTLFHAHGCCLKLMNLFLGKIKSSCAPARLQPPLAAQVWRHFDNCFHIHIPISNGLSSSYPTFLCAVCIFLLLCRSVIWMQTLRIHLLGWRVSVSFLLGNRSLWKQLNPFGSCL